MKNNIQKLKFEEYGSGKPILFVHGLGSNSQCWNKQIEEFKETHNVITVDLFGHGVTEYVPNNLTIKYTAKQINNYLFKNNKQGVIVVGHSLGGLIALEMARMDISLDLLVVVDTPTKQPALLRFKFLRWLVLKSIKSDFKTVIKAHYQKMGNNQDLKKYLTETALKMSPEAYYKYMKDLFKINLSKSLNSIENRVLLIFTNTLVPKKEKLSVIEKKYGYNHIRDRVVRLFPDAGHFVMLEKPADFNKLLKSFIE